MKTKTVAQCALLTALALVLSWVESLVPLSVAVPGVKLGLPNAVVLFALYRMGRGHAWLVSLTRVLLVSLLFGSFATLAYSLAGAVVSLSLMCLLYQTGKFSPTGVSVAGGVAHNAGQIAAAACLMETPGLVGYLPVLCITGTLAGICVGLLGGTAVRRVKL